jgi:hypothetical protein
MVPVDFPASSSDLLNVTDEYIDKAGRTRRNVIIDHIEEMEGSL